MEIINLSNDQKETPDRPVLKITDIKAAVKNDNRANIFINDEFAFSLDLAQIVDFHLKIGQVVTEAELKQYQHASEYGKLYQSALEWVFIKPRSIQETRDYLRRKLAKRKVENKIRAQNSERPKEERERYRLKTKQLALFSEQDIESILQKLIKRKYLDDVKFTQEYIENRNLTKGTSLKKMRQELIKKGISQELIEDVIHNSERNDRSELTKIIAKKGHKYSNPEKLKAYLLRQGFSYSDISEVLDNE